MKRFKLVSIISLFLLSSCSLFNSDFKLEARYVKKNSSEELTSGETIKYGENFNFDHFVLYKISNGNASKLDGGYKVTLLGTEGLSEAIFKSNTPEVGNYDFIFEYKEKTTSISFRVDTTNTLPSNVSMSVENWDFLGDKIRPTFTNYTPSQNANITYYLCNASGQSYGTINFDDGETIKEKPGNYKIKAEIYDEHYSGAILWCDFKINKVDFRSDILEIYNTSFSYVFSINHFKVGDYFTPTPRIRYKDTKRDLNVPQEGFSLSWKDGDEIISTDDTTFHRVILHTDCFNDYEYVVYVNVSKLEVDEPAGVFIDNIEEGHGDYIQYDGEEHYAHIRHNSYMGQYRVNEELSALSGTEKGTYKVVVELVDKTNLKWKKTHDTEDLTFYWYIT